MPQSKGGVFKSDRQDIHLAGDKRARHNLRCLRRARPEMTALVSRPCFVVFGRNDFSVSFVRSFSHLAGLGRLGRQLHCLQREEAQDDCSKV